MTPRKSETPATTSTADLLDGASDVPEVQETTVTDVVIHKPGGALATLDSFSDLMEEEANKDQGFEEGDIAIPFVRVLQSNSPQVKRQNPKYIDGAEAGDFLNTAAGQVYKELHVVPVVFRRQATLWRPRTDTSPGGFEGEIPVADAEELLKTCKRDESTKGKSITTVGYRAPNGDQKAPGLEVVIAAMYYCLQVEDDSVTPIAFPLSSTQMKKARSWNAVMSNSRLPAREGPGSYTPPLHGFMYKITTIPESNAKGDWMGVKITQQQPLLKFEDQTNEDGTPKPGPRRVAEGFVGAAQLYQAAAAFKKQHAEGKVKVKQEAEDDYEVVSTGGGATTVGANAEDDAKLPF